jgi:hypothetical protein
MGITVNRPLEPNAELARLRRSISYKPTQLDNAPTILRRAEAAGSAAFDPTLNDEICEQIHRRFRDPSIVNELRRHYECVTLLVGSELDTSTPGNRGLGRVTTATPRLGGTFRSELNSSAAQMLGPVMEELCICGYGAGVVIDAAGTDGPSTVRDRDHDALLYHWVGRNIDTARTWPDPVVELVFACAEDALTKFRDAASSLGLARGLRSKHKLELVDRTGFLLVSAGAELFASLTKRGDRWFHASPGPEDDEGQDSQDDTENANSDPDPALTERVLRTMQENVIARGGPRDDIPALRGQACPSCGHSGWEHMPKDVLLRTTTCFGDDGRCPCRGPGWWL